MSIKKYISKEQLMCWLFMASVMLGGSGLSENNNEYSNDGAKKIARVENKKTQKDTVVNAGIKTINPDDENFVDSALAEYWPEIAVGLTEFETYRAVSKRHGSERRETNGLGSTYHYKYDKKGVLRQYPNILGQTKRWSKDKNYEQCKLYLEYALLPKLQRALKGKQNIDARQAIAILWSGYQRPAEMDDIAERVSDAKNMQQVADAFAYTSVASKWRTGTLKRRWWCAAYAVGLISTNDFLSLNPDGFAEIKLNEVYKNGHFVLDAETVAYAMEKAGTRDGTVGEFLADFSEGKKILTVVKTSAFEIERGNLAKKESKKELKSQSNDTNKLVAKKYSTSVSLENVGTKEVSYKKAINNLKIKKPGQGSDMSTRYLAYKKGVGYIRQERNKKSRLLDQRKNSEGRS